MDFRLISRPPFGGRPGLCSRACESPAPSRTRLFSGGGGARALPLRSVKASAEPGSKGIDERDGATAFTAPAMEVTTFDRGFNDAAEFPVWDKIGAVVRLSYGIGIYGAMALAGRVICSVSGIDSLGGFHPSLDAILDGLGYAAPPIMALLFILDDEVVKLSPHARAIRDVEDEELRSFFYGMSPWQFILVVAASSVGEELFYRAAVQGALADIFLRGTDLVTDAKGMAALTGMLPPFVPFAQAFAAVITAVLTGSLYYMAASPKDPTYVVAPVLQSRSGREDLRKLFAAWYERRQMKKIYSPLLEGLLALYLGFEWIQTSNILAPIITHGIYSATILGHGLWKIHDHRRRLRQRVEQLKVERSMALLQWLKEELHPSMLFMSIFLLFMLLKFLLKDKKLGRRKPNLPPGPPKLPIIGNLHLLGDSPHISLSRLAHKLGPIFHLQLGQIPTVVVSSPRLAKEVLKTHDLALASRPQIFSAKHLFYDCTDVAFSPYGPYWRHVRKICTLELFSAKRVQSFGFIREDEVARLAHRAAQSYPATTDLSRVLGMYANDVLCRAAFGRDFSAGGEYDRHGFQNMLEEYQELLGGLSVGDFFPSMEFIHSFTGMKARLVRTFQRFDQFFDEIIEQHRHPDRPKQEHQDLVDVLLELHEDESMELPLTIDNVKAIILDMFAAGTDTSFITLDWGMTELLMNPRVMKKAQDEVRSIVGEKKVVAESDLGQLHYMKAIIKEIFRLHPPAPVSVPRESMEDVTIDGYDIPAKTRIFTNLWAIGRDKESWIEPEKFEPERFMGSKIDFKGQDFELIPFGAGRRMCPAVAFGAATVELALAQLLHSFDWELPQGVEAKDLDMTEVFGITMHRRAHLNVVAKPCFKFG